MGVFSRRLDLLAATLGAVLLAAVPAGETAAAKPRVLVQQRFSGEDRLVTNEFAYWSPSNPARVSSRTWEMTSGSLFVRSRRAWTGVPDVGAPGAQSALHSNSAIFRLTTRRYDLRNVSVAFRLRTEAFIETSSTPAVPWDGVHVFLRYLSQEQLYYVSVDRRDGTIVVKKKVPGGSSNGGTYYTLAAGKAEVPVDKWVGVRTTVANRADGSVRIRLALDGQPVLLAVDDGSLGGPPIRKAGAVGIRGDNCEFELDDFAVRRL